MPALAHHPRFLVIVAVLRLKRLDILIKFIYSFKLLSIDEDRAL
jgi:hypothetical protein